MVSIAAALTVALLIVIFWLVQEFDFGGISFTFFFLSSLAMQCLVFLRARPPIPRTLLQTLKANIPKDDYAFLRIVGRSAPPAHEPPPLDARASHCVGWLGSHDSGTSS